MYNFVQILKLCVMKNLVVLTICLVLSFTVKSQDRSHFKSDIITYEVIDTMWTEIKPLYNDTNSSLIVNGINEGLVMENMLNVVNTFRKNNGVPEVFHSIEISQDLESSIVNSTPLNFGFTWGTYGLFSEYGYVSNAEDIESRFCQYLIDVMSLDYDLYKTIVDPNNTEVGCHFIQDLNDKTYSFMFLIK